MDPFNNTAGDLLMTLIAHAGTWYGLICAALLSLLSLAGRQANRRHGDA